MKSAPDWHLFEFALRQDITHSQQLLQILHAERKALEERDYTELDNLISQKKMWLEKLEANAAQRRHWLQKYGFADDSSALETLRSTAPAVARCWEEAAAAWSECQNASQINDQICRRTRLVVERVLDILRGQTSNAATYDANGSSQRESGGRIISNA